MSIITPAESSLNGGFAPNVDVSKGGQQGIIVDPANIASGARHVRQRAIAILVQEAPLMRYMPDAQKRYEVLRSLVEDRALSWTGLNSTLNANFAETVENNNGEVRETVVRTTIDRAVPAGSWPEAPGRSINLFWEAYIRDIMMDPDLGIPLVTTYDSYTQDASPLPIIEANQGFTTLFFEPNASFTDVSNAILCTNMQPKSGGENVMSRNVGEDLETPNVEVEFTAMTSRSQGVTEMARRALAAINRGGLNPNLLPTPVSEISANVASTVNGFATNS